MFGSRGRLREGREIVVLAEDVEGTDSDGVGPKLDSEEWSCRGFVLACWRLYSPVSRRSTVKREGQLVRAQRNEIWGAADVS